MSASSLARLVQVHKALAHPARLRILAMLRAGELCVCQIVEVLGLAPSTVSSHLRELRRAGLTAERRAGRWVHVGLAAGADLAPLVSEVLERVADDPQVVADLEMVRELRRVPVADLCRFGFEDARRRLSEPSKEMQP